MNIIFDFEIKDHPNFRVLNKDAVILADEIRHFVCKKLQALKLDMVHVQQINTSFIIISIKHTSIIFAQSDNCLPGIMQGNNCTNVSEDIFNKIKKLEILFMNTNTPNLN